MSDLLNEQLSALMDGELPPEETALLLRRLEREPELAARLARYSAIGDALRGDRAQPSAGFAARASAAIAAEPAPVVRPVARAAGLRRRIRPLMGFSVAAAVGALAVVLVSQGPRGPETVQPAVVAANTAVPVVPVPPVERPMPAAALLASSAEPASYVTPAPSSAPLRPISGATLANYVAAHARVSGSLGGRDVLIHLVSDPAVEDQGQP